MSLKLEGVFPPVPTPFDADGEILPNKLKANIALWNRTGLHGYVILGSNGEAVMLTEQEKIALWQAALAYAPAKNETAALTHARTALIQFAQLGMIQRAPTFYNNITQKLRESGMTNAADTLQREFGDQIKALVAQGFGAPASRGRLPSKCPHCAGPARSDEVEWIDAQSAECVYCGGVIQTE